MQKCSIIIHHLKRTPLIQGSTCNARLFQAAIIGEVTCQVFEYENYDNMTSPHLSSYHLGQSYMTIIDECNEYDLRVFTNDNTNSRSQRHSGHTPPCKSTSPGGNLVGSVTHARCVENISLPYSVFIGQCDTNTYEHLQLYICNAKNTFATYCLVPASG